MKRFLTPKKLTWIVFAFFILLNLLLSFVVSTSILPQPFQNALVLAFLLQVGFVFLLLAYAGLPVILSVAGPGIPVPNIFGWVVIAATVVVVLMIYYGIASLISRLYYRRKNTTLQEDG